MSFVARAACIVIIAAPSACRPDHRVVSPFGSLSGADGVSTRRYPHDAVDIAMELNEHVIAAADGVVVSVSSDSESGITVEIAHRSAPDLESAGAQYHTAYSHLSRALVSEGDQVGRGQAIGKVGIFRASGGVVHLHWSLCVAACTPQSKIDPMTRTVGCYKGAREHESSHLELTLPFGC